MRILLLEDDPTLSETIADLLRQEGYDVDVASFVSEAETLTFDKAYDLYLIDINLPDGNGLDLLSELRFAEDGTPTIFITALHDLDAMARSFDLGAMDYIKKPFAAEELLIRIRAKFRSDEIKWGDLSFDPQSGIIKQHGKVVDLPNVQVKILSVLLRYRGQVVEKEKLYECLEHPSDTALRVALTKIKQKLGIEIKNIRGRGYMLEAL